MYRDRPIIQRLMAFKNKNAISFHVPGHKHGFLSELPPFLKDALPFDVTELNGLDDLHQPEDIIALAQQKLSQFYQSNQSFFLVNGSTVGNLAMIYATCREGDYVIVQRNAHKSIFHAIELVKAKPILITPKWDEKTLSFGTIHVQQIKGAMAKYPNVKAVVLTSPTYYGVTESTLKDLIQWLHKYNIPVLVDEAHGAHFAIGSPFPKSALQLGADVVVHSAHKTLPAMTMASFLHVKSAIVSPDRISKYLQMLQSSSPSYLLMASLDDARNYVESYSKEDVKHFINERNQFIQCLENIPLLEIVEVEDPLKLLIRVKGYTGFQLLHALEKEGIYAELADLYQVLFILPLLKEKHRLAIEQTGEKIKRALQWLVNNEKKITFDDAPHLSDEIVELCYNKDEIEELETEWVHVEHCLGKIAAASIIPYPPGIPLLLPGERIREEDIQMIAMLMKSKANFQGAICTKENKILVVMNE